MKGEKKGREEKAPILSPSFYFSFSAHFVKEATYSCGMALPVSLTFECVWEVSKFIQAVLQSKIPLNFSGCWCSG